jgi:hypothetical protein
VEKAETNDAVDGGRTSAHPSQTVGSCNVRKTDDARYEMGGVLTQPGGTEDQRGREVAEFEKR